MNKSKAETNKRGIRKAWPIMAAVALLAAGIVILAIINASGLNAEQGALNVITGGQTRASYTLTDIRAMPQVEAEKTIESAKHAAASGLYRGVLLRDVIALADEAALSGEAVYAYAEDGYVASYAMDEIATGETVLLVYSKDGEELKPLKDGGAGPYQIIVTSDPFGTRFCKNVIQIEVK